MDPLERTAQQAAAQQQHHDMGQLKGLIGETALRMDRIEGRFKSVDERLVQVLAVVGRTEVKNVLLATVCGAFCGCLSGMATTALMLHYAVRQGWIG